MVDPLNSLFFNDLSSASHSRDRIVVSTSRCGRDNPGSNPGHGKQLCSVAVTALWANFLSIFGQVNAFRTTSINQKNYFLDFFPSICQTTTRVVNTLLITVLQKKRKL